MDLAHESSPSSTTSTPDRRPLLTEADVPAPPHTPVTFFHDPQAAAAFLAKLRRLLALAEAHYARQDFEAAHDTLADIRALWDDLA